MDNLADGFKLMAIGMGMVFLFLTIMVYVISFMAKVLEPYSHLLADETPGSKGPSTSKKVVKAKSDDLVSAIVAAVHKYRSEH